jgi:hypothetical protein
VAREGVEAVEATIARAVDRVSLPHAARLLGRVESARGYRLPGYGLVLVLTPRTLPGDEGRIYVLQETEAARRDAEAEMERIVQDMRVRVFPPSEVHVEVAPRAPAAPSAPTPVEAPLPPAPPPWKFWFEAGTPEETRTPDRVIADVRGAVVDALAAGGVRLVGLAGDERVTVAVDFVPGGIFAAPARPKRTLVVSVRAKDADARARGAITPEELRKRVEVTEY